MIILCYRKKSLMLTKAVLTLLDKTYSKNSNTVKYYYNPTQTQTQSHKHLQDSLLTVNILIFSNIAALCTIP